MEQPGDAIAPYFYLSYARGLQDGFSGPANPDLWVHRLYDELCEHIKNMTDHRGAPGFMDGTMRVGQIWPQELGDSLARCRVFVPLYSPRYFISTWCGREWAAFGSRAVRHRTAGQPGVPSAVVPALWSPVPDHRLPDCVKDVQYTQPELGERYRTFGLYGLAKLRAFRNDYEKAVLHLARRIVDIGESIVVDHADRIELSEGPDAFADTPATTSTTGRTLRISVAAPSRDRLPEGRTPDYYGPSAVDWTPYLPASDQPLAQVAAGIAERLAFRPDIRDFDHTAGPAEGPEVVLLDRWVLRDPERRAALAAFDASDLPPTGLVVPWNEHDPDSDDAEHELGMEAEATLPRRIRLGRQACRPAVRGVPDQHAFAGVLPDVVQWAEGEYRKRAQARPPAGQGTERFRLCGKDHTDSRPEGHRRNAEEEDRDERP